MTRRANWQDRRHQRGQVMVLFGLFAVLLFVIAGLSIDAGMSYLASDRAERAAAAAALAGVAYLPSDTSGAQNAALVEAARNGFTNAGSANSCAGNPSPCVTTAQPATNQLKVTISVSVQTTFLRLAGFGAHTVTRTATAEYLPPIEIGQPGSQQGSDLESPCDGLTGGYCTSPAAGLGSGGSNYYFMRTEGWGNPRSEGDPFTPSPNQSSDSATGSPDVHEISQWNGTEATDATLNYVGGSNYLIDVPAGQKADVQVFNPSFAPDTNESAGGYTFHEDDSSFPQVGLTNKTQYSTMGYTVFTVPTLSSHTGDKKQRQVKFYPFNASCLYKSGTGAGCSNTEGFYYFNGAGTQVNVNTSTPPAMYHKWVSVVQPPTFSAQDSVLYSSVYNNLGASYLDNTAGTTDKYWRLEVDNLDWQGNTTCTSTTCTTPATPSSGDSTAHKGYAVRVVTPGQTTCTSCGSISAMSDMIMYTPIKTGSSSGEFSIPLFKVDQAYAGHTIVVSIFDPGDVSGGNAYMGLQLPNSTTYATASSITLVGNSLGSGGTTSVPYSTSPSGCDGLTSACFQTANSGGVIYNGKWIQMQIQVPASFNYQCSPLPSSCYWNLVYSVGANVTAGDTLAVQVGFAGSPDHLLP